MTEAMQGQNPVSLPAPLVLSIDPSAVNARYQLMVAMTWPRSPERRNEAPATFAALAIDKAALGAAAEQTFGRESSEAIAVAMRKNIEDEALKIKCQVDTVIRTIVPHVGGVLHFAAQLERLHPDVDTSLRRAWEVLKVENRPGPKKKVQDDISTFRRSMWNDYACIAPLCAAYTRALSKYRAVELLEHGEWGGVTPNWSEEEIGIILGWAKWFRQWATGFVQPRSTNKTAFIPDDEAVIYETSAPELEPELNPISTERLKAARSYHWRP